MPHPVPIRSRPGPNPGPKAFAISCLLFCAVLARISAMTHGPDLLIGVAGGVVRGRMLPDGHGAVFKGIPFAQPPVGDLRWREPMPVAAWTGVRDAGQSGPPATQAPLGWNDRSASASGEDCLYLDVWTPAGQAPAHNPVMVWIHGGANVAGAGGFDPLYDGAALIGRGVVLVVVEYRLGVFGFLAHPELTRESPHHASGNYAILDQIAALRWVHDYIAGFRGDPGNVTIFGQSAGSEDVLALMASPLSQGLFQRAIGESGPITQMKVQTLDEAEEAGARVAGKLGRSGHADLLFLRTVAPGDLLEAGAEIHSFTTEGWVFPSSPLDVWSAGKEHRVPLIIGSNAVEFRAGGSLDGIRQAIRDTFGTLSPKALALYGLDGKGVWAADPVYGDAADQWGSDVFRCPAVVQGQWHNGAGNPVWEYEFDRAIPPRPRVGHSSDLPYVFGNLYPAGSQGGDYQEADRDLSATIQAYWTNFARTGDPNGPGLPRWPQYEEKGRTYLTFTAAAGVALGRNQRGPFCDLFRELMDRPAPAR
ncbi:MAG TPA: carboxylesterase family protein [Opitutaceae bacterium]|nr:carboxylesterase family protein [Opitutaceae bacterium]